VQTAAADWLNTLIAAFPAGERSYCRPAFCSPACAGMFTVASIMRAAGKSRRIARFSSELVAAATFAGIVSIWLTHNVVRYALPFSAGVMRVLATAGVGMALCRERSSICTGSCERSARSVPSSSLAGMTVLISSCCTATVRSSSARMSSVLVTSLARRYSGSDGGAERGMIVPELPRAAFAGLNASRNGSSRYNVL